MKNLNGASLASLAIFLCASYDPLFKSGAKGLATIAGFLAAFVSFGLIACIVEEFNKEK